MEVKLNALLVNGERKKSMVAKRKMGAEKRRKTSIV